MTSKLGKVITKWMELLQILAQRHRHDTENDFNWQKIFNFIEQNAEYLLKILPSRNNEDMCTVLHYACTQGSREISTKRITRLLEICKRCDWPPSKIREYINQRDSGGNTALQLATEKMNKSVIKLLLEAGADIATVKKKRGYTTELLYNKMLTDMYDDSIRIKKENTEADDENMSAWKFEWDFSPVTGRYNESKDAKGDLILNQTRALHFLIRDEIASKEDILGHPLVRVFLFFKEEKFAWLLYLSMIYHIIWSIITFGYIFCNTHIVDSTNIENTARDSNLTELCQPFKMFKGDSPTEFVSSWAFYFVLYFYIFSIGKELIEFFSCKNKLHYMRQMGNIGQWFVIIIVFIVWLVNVINRAGDTKESFLESSDYMITDVLPTLYVLAMFASLLLVQVELGKTKMLGRHIEMFVYGFTKIVIFLLAFLPLFTAFLFIFHLLLPMRSEFVPSWGLGFAKILSMLTGEVNYDDTFYSDDEDEIAFRSVLKIFVLIFIIVVVILLQNLLIAMNVSDAEELRKQSELRNLASKLEDIYLIENFMTHDLVRKIMSWGTDSYETWYKQTFIVDETSFRRKLLVPWNSYLCTKTSQKDNTYDAEVKADDAEVKADDVGANADDAEPKTDELRYLSEYQLELQNIILAWIGRQDSVERFIDTQKYKRITEV